MNTICNKLPTTMLVLGPSGSGKDTQIDILVEKCMCEKIGTGDMFRVMYEQGVKGSKEANEYIKRGEWVPDKIVYELFAEWLKRYDSEKHWIFSQVVRTKPQVSLLDQLLEGYGRSLGKVIYFSLSDKAAIERMSLRRHCPECGKDYHLKYNKPKKDEVCDDCRVGLVMREDDNPKAILSRLREFNSKTRPILDIYSSRGILIEIDASPSIEEIHKELIVRLTK
ncbi:MAG: nucleoside monophosphate kinase [Patescibacteria group bacterium]|nr:nucleoside monophosphate kinase [Patescibacteria group bacterium]